MCVFIFCLWINWPAFHLQQIFIFSEISFGLRPAPSRLVLTLPALCRSHGRQVARITAAHITAFWLYHFKHNGPSLLGFHCLVTLIVGTTPIVDTQSLFKCVATFDRAMEITAQAWSPEGWAGWCHIIIDLNSQLSLKSTPSLASLGHV